MALISDADRGAGEPPITHGAVMRSVAIGEFRLTYTDHAPQQRVRRHAHAVAALTVPLHGGFVEVIEGRELVCRPGAVLFKIAGAEHENHYSANGAHSLIVEIPPAILSRLAMTMTIRSVVAEVMEGIPWATALRLHRVARAAPDVALLGFEEFVCQLIGNGLDRVRPRSARPPLWLRRVRDRIEGDSSHALSLAALAGEADVHPVYLARAFRRHYGCSVGEWVQRRRIDQAVVEITRTQEPIAQIAVRLGYCDQSHLTRQFRRLTGATPAAFRRMAAFPRQA